MLHTVFKNMRSLSFNTERKLLFRLSTPSLPHKKLHELYEGFRYNARGTAYNVLTSHMTGSANGTSRSTGEKEVFFIRKKVQEIFILEKYIYKYDSGINIHKSFCRNRFTEEKDDSWSMG